MAKIKSLKDLQKIKKSSVISENITLIKVGMATCGIASGAKEIMKFLTEECDNLAVDATIKQTGCLGYCYAEPMVEVKKPGMPAKIFGYVDKKRATEIIEKYILAGEDTEGVIDVSFKTIDE